MSNHLDLSLRTTNEKKDGGDLFCIHSSNKT